MLKALLGRDVEGGLMDSVCYPGIDVYWGIGMLFAGISGVCRARLLMGAIDGRPSVAPNKLVHAVMRKLSCRADGSGLGDDEVGIEAVDGVVKMVVDSGCVDNKVIVLARLCC